MSPWLFLVIVSAVNLVLGAMTAIYLRKQIELLAETTRREAVGAESAEPLPSPGDRVSVPGEEEPETRPPEIFSGGETGEKLGGFSEDENASEDAPFVDNLPSGPADSEGSSGDLAETPGKSTESLQANIPDTVSQPQQVAEGLGLAEETPGEIMDLPDGEDSAEDPSVAEGEVPGRDGTPSAAEFDQASSPVAAENGEGAGSETIAEEHLAQPQAEQTQDFADWQSPILNLIRLVHKTISRLRITHDHLFQTPPSDRDRLATVLASVEPEVDELIHSYHQSLPRIVGEGPSQIPDDLLAQLQQRMTALQGLEVRMSSLDLRGDFSATLKEAQAEWGHLLAGAHALRDALEVAFAAGVAAQATRPSLDAPICRDPLTNLLNRTGVEVFFEGQSLRHLARDQLAAVLFDLDQFRKINERFGHAVGDQVLTRVADVLRGQNLRDAVWARYAGDQFLLLLPRAVLRRTVEEAERIRQQMEATLITVGQESVSLTLSAAITELRTDDTTTSFFRRLEETLQHAKKAGGNRSFTHDGRAPAPVIPPNLQVASRTIQVSMGDESSAVPTDEITETFLRR